MSRNKKQEDFYKLVDSTYQYLGIQNTDQTVKTEPDKGNLWQNDDKVYSSDRAEGYALQRIMQDIQR